MIKKIISVFLITAIILGLCSCGKTSKSSGYICRRCGSSNVRAGNHNTQTGIQNFWCNDCGYSWTKFDNGMYGDKYGYGF